MLLVVVPAVELLAALLALQVALLLAFPAVAGDVLPVGDDAAADRAGENVRLLLLFVLVRCRGSVQEDLWVQEGLGAVPAAVRPLAAQSWSRNRHVNGCHKCAFDFNTDRLLHRTGAPESALRFAVGIA